MKKLLFCFFFGMLSFYLLAQYKDFTIDEFGNIYLWTDFQLSKFTYTDSSFVQIFNFSTDYYGAITDVDVSNPFKIVIYLGHFGKVLVIDDEGSLLSEYDLHSFVFSPDEVCYSLSNDALWVYDNFQRFLYLIDIFSKRVICSKQFFSECVVDTMFEQNSKLFLVSSNDRVYSVDRFCNFLGSFDLPFSRDRFVGISDSVIYCLSSNYIYKVNFRGEVLDSLRKPNYVNFRIAGSWYYFFKKGRIFRKKW